MDPPPPAGRHAPEEVHHARQVTPRPREEQGHQHAREHELPGQPERRSPRRPRELRGRRQLQQQAGLQPHRLEQLERPGQPPQLQLERRRQEQLTSTLRGAGPRPRPSSSAWVAGAAASSAFCRHQWWGSYYEAPPITGRQRFAIPRPARRRRCSVSENRQKGAIGARLRRPTTKQPTRRRSTKQPSARLASSGRSHWRTWQRRSSSNGGGEMEAAAAAERYLVRELPEGECELEALRAAPAYGKPPS